MSEHDPRSARLPTAVPTYVGLVGVAGFCVALWISLGSSLATPARAAIIAVLTALPMVAVEWWRTRRQSPAPGSWATPAPAAPPPDRTRDRMWLALLRLIGGMVTVAPFLAFHVAIAGLMTSQRVAMLVAMVYALLSLVIGATAALVAPSAVAGTPEIRLGQWVLRRTELAGDETIGDHFRVWALKLFFIPFLAAALPGNTGAFERTLQMLHDRATWTGLVMVCHQFFYLLDVTVGLIGYVLTTRILGSHIRSANPYREAWLFCLICYPPFWDPIRIHILAFDTGGITWDDYFEFSALAYAWGIALVLLEGIYVWATVAFGVRFSNLTNRGILTTGPYALVKHPAYLAKNASWWLWYLPFVPVRGVEVAVVDCLQLAVINLLYFMRAKTEEHHLREDPAYREYEAWMASRPWWRRLVRWGR